MAIDLYCGLGGWSEGLIAEGWRCIGFDIERHEYGEHRYPGQLVIQDVLTLHGSQFRNADLIVASPPCTEYSWMAMPWSRAKQTARALRGEDELFPTNYRGSRTVEELNALFNACFRIQREACEAAGRHIPLIVENVRGAIPWVGRSRWNFGSFHLWGDVPALMPVTLNAHKVPSFRFDGSGGSFQSASVRRTDVGNGVRFTSRDCGIEGVKIPGLADGTFPAGGLAQGYIDGVKQSGISGPRDNGKGDRWFQDGAAQYGSKSNARKAASAMIAKIPEPLARHIARAFHPGRIATEAA